ncbi:inner-membrane translocator [Aquibacillus sediminis]|uniref:inner-membrane translocator n=1 Tax=Aquibacillus sediminis TaxID=2574734 RepID=UPI0011096F3B|nr:inner-membrane translocator [Aquibacillus sediminis]
MILFIFLALILLLDGAAIYFHSTGKIALWLSGIVMGVLAPILGYSLGFVFLQLSRTFDPTSTHEGAGYAGAFIVLGLLANAMIFFIIGIIIKIVHYFKSK